MGQYYRPINLSTMQSVHSHRHDNGLKLMEHSWLGNNFVYAIEKLLMPGGPWYKCPLVWCGDYADRITEAGQDVYSSAVDLPVPVEKDIPETIRYAVNWSKCEFVTLDRTKMPGEYHQWEGETFKMVIHPLPLLSGDGNGQGGGDYRPPSEELGAWVGSWAGDLISIEVENDWDNRVEWKEITPDFVEFFAEPEIHAQQGEVQKRPDLLVGGRA